MATASAAKSGRSTKVKESTTDRIFNVVLIIVLILLNILMLYPFLYVLSTSISDPGQVMAGNVWLWPVGFDLTAMKQIMQYPLFLNSYLNTILYSVGGTCATLFMTSLTAYPLAQSKFRLRGAIAKIYLFTMFFGGGMIPTYLVYKDLGLVDNIFVMILPGALTAWNIILCRTFFQGIPESLHESAYLDGASDWTILWRIVMPLSKPVLATIALFSMVGIWNDFFTGLIYFNDNTKFPLQLILRMILINASMSGNPAESGNVMDFMQRTSTQALKSASIVISIAPIICVYPFIQKYFVKGVMIGSVKG